MRNGVARATIALILFGALTAQSMVEGGEPKIGPATDRVGLPDNYRTAFEHVRTAPAGKDQTLVVYANQTAASVKNLDKLPYPYGSVIVAEWRRTDSKGGEGTPFRINVMRRERGYGEAYWRSADGRVGICPLSHRRQSPCAARGKRLVRILSPKSRQGARLGLPRPLLAISPFRHPELVSGSIFDNGQPREKWMLI